MFSHVSVHPSICLSTPGGGVTPARSRSSQGGSPARGGTPPWVPPVRPGGYSYQGVPHLRYPPSDLGRGVPPQSDLGRGYTMLRGYPPGRGVPHLRWYPPSGGTPPQTWLGGTPTRVCPPLDLAGGGVPHFWKQMEYLIRRGRYASCVHAAGLSCSKYFNCLRSKFLLYSVFPFSRLQWPLQMYWWH